MLKDNRGRVGGRGRIAFRRAFVGITITNKSKNMKLRFASATLCECNPLRFPTPKVLRNLAQGWSGATTLGAFSKKKIANAKGVV